MIYSRILKFEVFRHAIGYMRVSTDGDRQSIDLQRDAVLHFFQNLRVTEQRERPC